MLELVLANFLARLCLRFMRMRWSEIPEIGVILAPVYSVKRQQGRAIRRRGFSLFQARWHAWFLCFSKQANQRQLLRPGTNARASEF